MPSQLVDHRAQRVDSEASGVDIESVTLNITLLSRNDIYQCADFRVTWWSGGAEDVFQKEQLISRGNWHAVLAFAGVGHTGKLNVADWLAEETAKLSFDAPFTDLIQLLKGGDAWLKTVPLQRQRHTFSVGAFVGIRPLGCLVSNFESVRARQRSEAGPRLVDTMFWANDRKILASGSGASHLDSYDRRRLLDVMRLGSRDKVYDELKAVNLRIASRDPLVSPKCCIAHINSFGEGGLRAEGVKENEEYMPKFVLPEGLALIPDKDEQGQDNPLQLVGVFTTRWEPTDSFQQKQLALRPNDPEVYNNYGAYLVDVEGNLDRAKEMYLRALDLKPDHAVAWANLGLVHWRKGELKKAQDCLETANRIDPNHAFVREKIERFRRAAPPPWGAGH